MAAAYFMATRPELLSPRQSREGAILFCFIFLYLRRLAAAHGAWTVFLRHRRHALIAPEMVNAAHFV